MTEQHIALYRKYRPQGFDDILGQEHIVKALQGAVRAGKVGHAYLFSGTRGTGKTSVARILAREIGCTDKDLYEIDAASNRGIDDVREIREAVNIMPFESPYKVYIIDEVHMLTKEAFNALLKTLEEPPSHVVFMLATTEPHKLPDTIISRCEQHHFKQPTQHLLKGVVEDTAKKEGYNISTDGAELIALLGDGSFRDTLGALQKVLGSAEGKKVTLEHIQEVTGAPDTKLVDDLVASIDTGDLDGALTHLSSAGEQNIDMTMFLKLILGRLRAVLLLRFAKDMKGYIADQVSESTLELLETIAANKESKINAAVLSRFLESYDQVSRTHIQQLPIELALIDMLGTPENT